MFQLWLWSESWNNTILNLWSEGRVSLHHGRLSNNDPGSSLQNFGLILIENLNKLSEIFDFNGITTLVQVLTWCNILIFKSCVWQKEFEVLLLNYCNLSIGKYLDNCDLLNCSMIAESFWQIRFISLYSYKVLQSLFIYNVQLFQYFQAPLGAAIFEISTLQDWWHHQFLLTF